MSWPAPQWQPQEEEWPSARREEATESKLVCKWPARVPAMLVSTTTSSSSSPRSVPAKNKASNRNNKKKNKISNMHTPTPFEQARAQVSLAISLLLLLVHLAPSIHLARAGLINSLLAHRYSSQQHEQQQHQHQQHRPPSLVHLEQEDLMNSSGSALVEQFAALAEGSSSSPLTNDYQSPINRIMELISGSTGHRPPPAGPPPPPLVLSQSRPLAVEAQTALVPAPEVSGSSAQQQHWHLLGPEGQQQVIQLAEQQEQLKQQHQQLLHQHQQPTPLASASLIEAQEEAQFFLAPSGPTPPQQVQLVPYHQHQHRPAPLEQPAAPQPIFLSSFVPEVLTGGGRGPATPSVKQQPAPAPQQPPPQVVKVSGQLVAPNSIQQANVSQVEAGGPADEEEGETEPTASQQQQRRPPPEAAAAAGEENDIEEPTLGPKAEAAAAADEGDGSDESMPSGSGSSNYREKYDSDTMDEPQRQSNKDDDDSGNQQQRLTQAESASRPSIGAGLIGVGLNDDCLQCICRASSGCDYQLGCITRGPDEKHCGPFQLTEDYWRAAGKPGDQATNFESFEECANDADCAVETVTNYMKKHHRDCDGDDKITCLDYARLHRLKPTECTKLEQLEQENNNHDYYWAKFQRCAETYNRSRTNGDDEDI